MNSHVKLLISVLAFPFIPLGNIGVSHPVHFKVIDEQGQAIQGATVVVSYQTGFLPGEGFGRDLRKIIQKKTNRNGEATIKVSPLGDKEFAYAVRDFEGRYHNDLGNRSVSYKDEDGETKRTITLRAKQSPVQLLYAEHCYLHFPISNGKTIGHEEALGYDVVADDWVTPYGKGKVIDFIFRFRYENNGRYATNQFGHKIIAPDWKSISICSLTFANEGDGILDAPEKWPTSVIPIDMLAPIDGYQKELRLVRHYPKKTDDFERQRNRHYFFRIRSQYDCDGNLVYALYGKIDDDFDFSSDRLDADLAMRIRLNPTPLCRNMEDNRTPEPQSIAQRTHINGDYIRRFPSQLLTQGETLRALPPLPKGIINDASQE